MKMEKLATDLHRRTQIQKNSVFLVLRSRATPQSSILCIRNYVGSFLRKIE